MQTPDSHQLPAQAGMSCLITICLIFPFFVTETEVATSSESCSGWQKQYANLVLWVSESLAVFGRAQSCITTTGLRFQQKRRRSSYFWLHLVLSHKFSERRKPKTKWSRDLAVVNPIREITWLQATRPGYVAVLEMFLAFLQARAGPSSPRS